MVDFEKLPVEIKEIIDTIKEESTVIINKVKPFAVFYPMQAYDMAVMDIAKVIDAKFHKSDIRHEKCVYVLDYFGKPVEECLKGETKRIRNIFYKKFGAFRTKWEAQAAAILLKDFKKEVYD